MKVGEGDKMLSEKKINDIQTWLSAALTNLDTCVESVDEMDPSLHEELEMKMKNGKQFMSNSLAIIAHMESLLHQLHVPIH
ncbi:pectinesterase [Ranunculus cassubicifolius]